MKYVVILMHNKKIKQKLYFEEKKYKHYKLSPVFHIFDAKVIILAKGVKIILVIKDKSYSNHGINSSTFKPSKIFLDLAIRIMITIVFADLEQKRKKIKIKI